MNTILLLGVDGGRGASLNPHFWSRAMVGGVALLVSLVLFDRLIAAFAYKSNAGYLIYVADFLGYLASVGVLVYKSMFRKGMTHVDFFIDGSYIVSIVGITAMGCSLAYFMARRKSWRRTP